MCMATEGARGWYPCMMDSNDDTGDGDGGKEICVMGTPVVGNGGGGGEWAAPVDGIAAVAAIGADDSGGAAEISEMTGPDAARAAIPP